MREGPRFVESAGHGEGLAVVGDRDVVEPCRPRSNSHRLGVRAPIGRGRVHVEIAAQVLDGHEAGQRSLLRGRKLAAILPKFRRDQRQPQCFVNALFGLPGDPDVVVNAKQSVLVQLESALNGAVAKGDVVSL